MKKAFSYLLVGFLWLLHWLPLPVLRVFGWLLGRLLYIFGRERREVALINLRLCFPEKTEAEREDLARRNFVAFSRAVIDRTLGWWASKERLERIIRITGVEHLKDPAGRPIILLSPHFVGLDAGATRISMHIVGCSVYSNQKNPVFNKLLYDGRMRFRQSNESGPSILLFAGHGFRSEGIHLCSILRCSGRDYSWRCPTGTADRGQGGCLHYAPGF